MCQECQEIEVGYSESSEAWDQTVEYGSEEKVLNSGIKEEVSGKVCTKCGEWKPLTEFGKDSRSKRGLYSNCKVCVNAYNRWRKSPDFVRSRMPLSAPPGDKLCSKCMEVKPFSEFTPDKRSKDGYFYMCRACRNAYHAWRKSEEYSPAKKEVEIIPIPKVCTKCGETKNISDFEVDKDTKDGHGSRCKACVSKYNAWYRSSAFVSEASKKIQIPGKKQCSRCGNFKIFSEFSVNLRSSDGLDYHCKECNSTYAQELKEKRKSSSEIVVVPVTKICTSCGVEKEIKCFDKLTLGKYGLNPVCKQCRLEKANIRSRNKVFSVDLTEEKSCTLCGDKKPLFCFYVDKRKRDGRTGICRDCYRKRNKLRYDTDVEYRLRIGMRNRLYRFTKNGKNISSARMMKYLGCTFRDLRLYLEERFYDNPRTGEKMTWENYGRPDGVEGWDIDHIFPLSKAILQDEEQFKRVCFFTNLQPMWGLENRQKYNHILPDLLDKVAGE